MPTSTPPRSDDNTWSSAFRVSSNTNRENRDPKSIPLSSLQKKMPNVGSKMDKAGGDSSGSVDSIPYEHLPVGPDSGGLTLAHATRTGEIVMERESRYPQQADSTLIRQRWEQDHGEDLASTPRFRPGCSTFCDSIVGVTTCGEHGTLHPSTKENIEAMFCCAAETAGTEAVSQGTTACFGLCG